MKRGLSNEYRFWANVEKTDSCWNWLAHKNNGYGRFMERIDGGYRPWAAHRYAYTALRGPIPDGMVIDHMCHNRSCVNPLHLQVVTSKQNTENRAGASPRSKSGIRGVYWDIRCKRWRGVVGNNNKLIHVGLFDSIDDAERATIAMRKKILTNSDLDPVLQ